MSDANLKLMTEAMNKAQVQNGSDPLEMTGATMELLAQGPETQWQVGLPLSEDQPAVIGRGDSVDLDVSWDRFVARRHVSVRLDNGKLLVQKFAEASNPLVFQGETVNECLLGPGEFFVLGRTRFLLASLEPSATDSEIPAYEKTFSIDELHRTTFNHTTARMEVLSRLPDVIANANDEEDLCQRMAAMVLAGIDESEAAVVVELGGDQLPRLKCQWESKRGLAPGLRLSKRLIREAAQTQQSTVHSLASTDLSNVNDMTVTANDAMGWTLCTPLRSQSCRNWFLYVTGKSRCKSAGGAEHLRGDVKFTELVVEICGALRDVSRLQQRETIYHQFFSDRIVAALGHQDPREVLTARVTEVVVLYCDLRGFSKLVEQEEAKGTPMEAFHIVERMLGIATRPILEWDGVIGDFQGDAVLGFWGWPEAQPDMVERACRAALQIRRGVVANRNNPHAAGRHCDMGIGLAKGRVVAGKIGSTDQMKISVFGGVVNLASRLEGMTKILAAPILVDEHVAGELARLTANDWCRTRQLGAFIPCGMQHPINIAELLPTSADAPEIPDEHVRLFEQAVEEFRCGNWEQSLEYFDQVPSRLHRAKDYFIDYIIRHKRTPPANFTGVIQLDSKN